MIGDLEKLREACAKVCDGIGKKPHDGARLKGRGYGANECSAAVRNLDLAPFALPTDDVPAEQPVEYTELNMNNYNDHEVTQLNEWGVWAYSRLDFLEAATHKFCQEIADLERQRNALQAKLAKRAVGCAWTYYENGAWETACGNAFCIEDGTPEDNEMRFCCYCGGHLKTMPYIDAAIDAKEEG